MVNFLRKPGGQFAPERGSKTALLEVVNLLRNQVVNLSGFSTNLSNANLRNANFSGANLSGALLKGADLRYANLTDTNLQGANLIGANLKEVDLSNANIKGAEKDEYLPLGGFNTL